MKRLHIALATAAVAATMATAGGDIAPVEPAVAVPPVVQDKKDADFFYVGIAYDYLSHDIDHKGGTTVAEMDFNSVMLQVGYQYNEYIAVEGRYAFTIGDDIDDLANSSDVTTYGIFLKPMLPLSQRAHVYGLAGFSYADASNDVAYASSVDDSGFSWGGGFALDVTEDLTGYVEYVRWFDDSTTHYDHVIDGFNLGLTYSF
jgi:opacity protein-like surface antigen